MAGTDDRDADRSRGWRRVLLGCLVGIVAAGVALALWLPGALEDIEYRTWDWRVRLFARPGRATDDVVLILLDQQSLVWGKNANGLSWPWPREMYAIVTDFCRRTGAKSLTFDALNTEPSFYGMEDDAAFGGAMADYGYAAIATFLAPEDGSDSAWPDDVAASDISISGLGEWMSAERPQGVEFPTSDLPIAELARGARALGNANGIQDRDGVYRRGTLFSLFAGRVVPSIGFAAWLAANPGVHDLRIEHGWFTIDGLAVPIDRNGAAILRFRSRDRAYTVFQAAEVIRSELRMRNGETPSVDPLLLKDKYVFFGVSARGLLDLRPSPVNKKHPGVEINATQLDNLLSGDFMRTVPMLPAVVLLVLLCIGAGVVVTGAAGAGRSGLAYALFIPLAPALAAGAYVLGWWLHFVSLELGTVLSLVGSSLVAYATEGKQKRFLKGAFRQYLSPTVIEQIIAHPERLKLGGELRELSVFFSDLQGFTTISKGLSPVDLTTLLNEYLSAMTDIIQEEGGTIDKYEGDAIIAFWNAPLEVGDHAVRAVRAALRCQAQLAAMRPGLKERFGGDLLMRIGLNSGPAVVGNMGSRNRFDYTMLGDAVNLAARLEGINKVFHTYTMVSAATRALMADAFPVRELSNITVVGREDKPLVVYEPMMPDTYAARRPQLVVFGRGLRFYYEGRFAEAAEVFAGIAADDPPAAAYVEQCRKVEKEHAGPWTGVWKMTEK
ncbi:MAG: adenylate/guanylate cyclase domain-containing protein [Spirochaetes bacterium]|nr:adenylate/guanylate cyclase domain-containing protein [Spirochaetota bacterium]